MSDDFDKEAEREKLREKYERDQQKREATEQMSELLLKGATMTNAHCSECGDPIFRYDDQEFCPTCEKPVDRDTDAEREDSEQDGDSEEIEVTTPSDEARVAFGDEEAENGADSAEAADAAESSEAADAERADVGGEPKRQDRSQQDRQPPAPEPSEQGARLPAQHEQELPSKQGQARANAGEASEASRTPDQASVTAARESLVRTLTRFSRLAEQTEDPRRAQEYLAAAREAAETLAELRR